MKKLFLLSIIFPYIIYSQNLKGVISNTEGETIEYVNIGIVGTNKGTISDAHGNFSLEKLQPKPTDSIYFSHISYKYKSLLAKDIKDKVVLQEANIVLPETTVKIKAPKIRTLKGKGLPTIVTMISTQKGRELSTKNETEGITDEVGDFITLKKDTQLTEFELSVNKNTFQKAIFRIEVYQSNKEHNIFIPLTKKPIYISIPYSKKKQNIVQKFSIFAPKGTIWVALRWVDGEGDKDASVEFRAVSSFGWMRYGNEIERFPLGLGIPFSIKGYEYEVVE